MALKSIKEKYQYCSLSEIDSYTFDYLKFVIPGDIYTTPIEDVNDFLNELEAFYEEMEKEREVAQHKRYLE